MTGANLSRANAQGVNFNSAQLTGADLSGADVRGADFQYAELDDTNTDNLIQSNGHIAGLDLTSVTSLLVRDYDGDPSRSLAPIAITVDQHLLMNADSVLEMIFDADAWNSEISFAPGIPVNRGGGTLELTFAPGVDLSSQFGRTIDLFDWTGVDPTGTFTVSSPYAWDLSQLYTTGQVTLTSVPEPDAMMLLGMGIATMLRRRSCRGTTRRLCPSRRFCLVSSGPQWRISEWLQS